MPINTDELLKIASKNEQAEIDCLSKLVGIPTCYNKNDDMKPIIAQLTQEFEKRGYEVKVYATSGASVIVAEQNQDMNKTLLFYNHYDVQPEEPIDEWKTPPYELTLRDQRLYGRGVSDNKGPLVANIFGVQTAVETGHKLDCNVRFIIEGEEEAGSNHLNEFCQAHSDLLRVDGCVWEEASATPNQRSEINCGVKGNAYFELHARGFSKDAHSGDAPIVVNPAWRLVWALNTLKNQDEQILMDNYYDDVVPPNEKELDLFRNYPPEQVEQYRRLYQTDRFLLGRDGVEFWKQLTLSPTCTICGLSAGWEGPGSKTVIGRNATAKLDFRLVPNQRVNKVQKMLREHLNKHGFNDLELRLLTGYEPAKTPIDHPFVQLLARTATEFSGKEPMFIPSSPGSGPAYLFRPYTPWATCETFDSEKNIHAPNESLRLNDLKNMTAFTAALTTQLGRA